MITLNTSLGKYIYGDPRLYVRFYPPSVSSAKEDVNKISVIRTTSVLLVTI